MAATLHYAASGALPTSVRYTVCADSVTSNPPCHSIFHCTVGECEIRTLVRRKARTLASVTPVTCVVHRDLPPAIREGVAWYWGLDISALRQPHSRYKEETMCVCQKYLRRDRYS